MGCFLACFRSRSGGGSHPSTTPHSTKESLLPRSQLGDLFSCGEEALCSGENEIEEELSLKEEAKFLKACGALLETPAEIQKTYQQPDIQIQQTDHFSDDSCELNDDSFRKLGQDQTSNCALLLDEESPLSKPESESIAVAVRENEIDECKIESMHLEDVDVAPRFEMALISADFDIPMHRIGYRKPLFRLEGSPYPTPLRLTDEMQTPGTVCLTNSFGAIRNGRIRSQYLYPMSSLDGSSDKKAQNKDVDKVRSDIVTEPSVPLDKKKRLSCENASRENIQPQQSSLNKELRDVQMLPAGELSLSQWLKPSVPEDKMKCNYAFRKDGKSRYEERPILGVVAENCNVEHTQVMKNWWDGNGIPNSTRKYKEDQKVNWHATPFEQRLEKALSNDSQPPDRKQKLKPITFPNGDEECNTTSSGGEMGTGFSQASHSLKIVADTGNCRNTTEKCHID